MDGSLEASGTSSSANKGSLTSPTNLYFGDSACQFTSNFAGTLDEVALYPSKLTAQQVSNHYSVGSGIPLVTGATATSIGDPQETTGDGKTFQNKQSGVFIKARSVTGEFEVQTRQDQLGQSASTIYNTHVGVKINEEGDVLRYDAVSDRLTFNGIPVSISNGGSGNFPNGGRVERLDNVYTITSEAGDKVTVTDQGSWIDVKLDASLGRGDGDISGSLGRFDADTDPANDLENRNGNQMTDTAAFIEEWRAQEGEAMLSSAPVAQDQNVTTAQDTAKLITLSFTDAENDPIERYVVTALPRNGKLYHGDTTDECCEITADDPMPGGTDQVTYKPNPGYAGSDSFKFRANDGQSSSIDEATVSINVVSNDTTAPTGSVSINNGAAKTKKRAVTLSLSATDNQGGSGVAQMCISNTTTCSSWQTYATSKSWTLAGKKAGTKTVYVRYKDRAGNESAVFEDKIKYASPR